MPRTAVVSNIRPLTATLIMVLLLGEATRGIRGLRLINLDVPTAVRHGESIWLNCTLDLESDELYSVKWYKNDVEFYRYLPRDSPSGQKYDLPGVYVDLKSSREGCVFLRSTDLDTEGLYRCEASAESPTFQTVEGEKQIKVYVLPQEDPAIYGNFSSYEVGDIVNVSCRSGPSKPVATLKWYINGMEAPQNFISSSTTVDHMNGLKTAVLGLSFAVKPAHLLQGAGAITLKCSATISQTYLISSEELVVGDRMAEPSSPSDVRIPLINQYSPRNGPVITGGHPHYKVGELLDVNCTSSKLRSAPELQWYLNDERVGTEHLVEYANTRHPGGQESSTLGLRFTVRPYHFDENDEMRLKCTATLSEVINTRSEEKTVGGNHRSSGLQASENTGRVSERNSGSECRSAFVGLTVLIVLANLTGFR